MPINSNRIYFSIYNSVFASLKFRNSACKSFACYYALGTIQPCSRDRTQACFVNDSFTVKAPRAQRC